MFMDFFNLHQNVVNNNKRKIYGPEPGWNTRPGQISASTNPLRHEATMNSCENLDFSIIFRNCLATLVAQDIIHTKVIFINNNALVTK